MGRAAVFHSFQGYEMTNWIIIKALLSNERQLLWLIVGLQIWWLCLLPLSPDLLPIRCIPWSRLDSLGAINNEFRTLPKSENRPQRNIVLLIYRQQSVILSTLKHLFFGSVTDSQSLLLASDVYMSFYFNFFGIVILVYMYVPWSVSTKHNWHARQKKNWVLEAEYNISVFYHTFPD